MSQKLGLVAFRMVEWGWYSRQTTSLPKTNLHLWLFGAVVKNQNLLQELACFMGCPLPF